MDVIANIKTHLTSWSFKATEFHHDGDQEHRFVRLDFALSAIDKVEKKYNPVSRHQAAADGVKVLAGSIHPDWEKYTPARQIATTYADQKASEIANQVKMKINSLPNRWQNDFPYMRQAVLESVVNILQESI